jgi:hypothetical protein
VLSRGCGLAVEWLAREAETTLASGIATAGVAHGMDALPCVHVLAVGMLQEEAAAAAVTRGFCTCALIAGVLPEPIAAGGLLGDAEAFAGVQKPPCMHGLPALGLPRIPP